MRPARFVSVLAAAMLAAGCGISSGPVHVDGQRARGDQSDVGSGLQVDFSRPKQATTAKQLVERYLLAAADEVAREKTLQGYLPKDEFWGAVQDKDINIIRLLEDYRAETDLYGNTQVKFRVQYVGKLSVEDGWLTPSNQEDEEIQLIVKRRDGEGLFISNPPRKYLLLESALNDYYEPRPLYFYEANGSRLVPDLRYVHRRLPEEGRATRLVQWLYDGPSPWLGTAGTAVRKPSDSTQPTSGKQVTRDDDGMLVVDLATQPTGDQLGLLAEQLTKTLGSHSVPGLRLQVQGQPLRDYPRPSRPTVAAPRRYGIVGGVVHRLKHSGPADSTPIPLPDNVNSGMSKVLFDREENKAVLVYQGESKRISVWQRGAEPVTVSLSARQVQQPLWLDATSFLLLADGKLYVGGLDGRVTPVSGADGISAFALGEERVRLAIVQKGRVGLTTLIRTQGAASLDPIQFLQTKFGGQVHNVAFSGTNELTIAGSDGSQVTIVSVNSDGAVLNPYRGDTYNTAVRISQLVAWPSGLNVMFEIQGLDAFEAQRNSFLPLEAVIPASSSPGTTAETKVSSPSLGD